MLTGLLDLLKLSISRLYVQHEELVAVRCPVS
jgi:hypothetical protein